MLAEHRRADPRGPARRPHPQQPHARRGHGRDDQDQRPGAEAHARRGRRAAGRPRDAAGDAARVRWSARAACRSARRRRSSCQVAGLAARYGVPFVLDTSGAPLTRAVRQGGLTLVKPNDEELAELVGRELTTVGDVVDAAREVIAAVHPRRPGQPRRARRPARRSPTASGGRAVPPLVPLSTVGAGDSTLAGFLTADGSPRRPPAHRGRLRPRGGPAARHRRPRPHRHRPGRRPGRGEPRSPTRPQGAVT